MKKEILDIISMSCEKETCYPRLQNTWSESNPNLGLGAITSLVVNDFCGGKIMRCMIREISHYYNLIDNKVVDLTIDPFEGVIPNYESGQEKTREYLFSSEETTNRYKKLLTNVKNNFKKYGTTNYELRDENNNKYVSKIPGTIGGNKKLKIYGKFDCSSALYWIEKGKYVGNRVFFYNEETAVKAGYRPCAKCMKKEYKLWKEKQKQF